MVEIKHKETGEVLHIVDADTLRGADLSASELSCADLSGANLTDADLTEANMTDADLTGAQLSGANLAGAWAVNADLSNADLTGANLTRANLNDALLIESNLTSVDLSLARMSGAQLSYATLIGARLYSTELDYANVGNADLTGANLGAAELSDTVFSACVSLMDAKGLDLVKHYGPSILDARTLRACVCKLPDVFLEGCGYNREEIEYLRAMYADKAFRYYSCFLSHASDDADFADRLHADLRANNVTCWYSRHDMKGGEDWMPQINAAIKSHEKLVLITSRRSIYRPVVIKEILAAIDQERKEGVQKLFPLRLDDHILSDEMMEEAREKVKSGEWPENWVYYVRKKHIPDFSKWQDHTSYKKELDNLLRDLKAQHSPK